MQQQARTDKELIRATAPFASEDRALSWRLLLVTLALFVASVVAAIVAPWWPVRAAAAVLEGLLIVRLFIFYHDFLHGAILRGSRVARALMNAYGILSLNPPRAWRDSHNYHHAHTAKIVGSHVGSYAMTTPALWERMSPAQRLKYRLQRHPITVMLGYLTIFLYGMCLSSFLRNPRKNWTSAAALAVHLILVAGVWTWAGPDVLLFAVVLPQGVACALGAYLFYAQHNFPGIHVQPRETWSYTRAALESSSYMELGPVMRWFTGNIGYHHVHHLNPRIPFYRLPEAMAALPELQSPCITTLKPRDIWACFKLKMWDPQQNRMVGYPEQAPQAAR